MEERWHVRAVGMPAGDGARRLVVADGRLQAEPVAGARELPGGWVAPGLVDAHAHLTFDARGRSACRAAARTSSARSSSSNAAPACWRCATPDRCRSVPVPDGAGSGVRVLGCGPFLAPPDFFIPALTTARPPARRSRRARARARTGTGWVKLVVDYPGADGNPLAPRLGYPLELVAEIAAAVHEAGGRLAAHVMGRVVRELVGLGIDSIEHGNWADEDTVRAMAVRGVAWTPTLTTVLGHLEPVADHVPPARELLDLQRRTLPLAAELGVTLLAGTDEEPHGSVAAGVAALARFGVPRPPRSPRRPPARGASSA